MTESFFSMDGDRAPLRELIELKKRFDALLMLDEAYAVGVIGLHGRGLAAAENLSDDIDVQMGTMSKALGASGGCICGSHDLIEWLINRARSFIYSTAPPPRNRRRRSSGSEFSFIFGRRGTKTSALGANQIAAGTPCVFGRWTFGC